MWEDFCCLFFFVTHGHIQNLKCCTWVTIYEWVMSHEWMSHITRMNKSCHIYGWVMAHIWTSHATRMEKSCHTYEWIMSHVGMSHVTLLNESCHTYEWVMSHMWINHIICMNESHHAYERVIHTPCHSHTCVSMSHYKKGGEKASPMSHTRTKLMSHIHMSRTNLMSHLKKKRRFFWVLFIKRICFCPSAFMCATWDRQ